MTEPVRLAEKLALFSEHWHPYIVAQMDGYHVKLAKVQGEFVWHAHDDQDELFFVRSGELTIRLRDRDLRLSEGDLFVVPKGVEHCPSAEREAAVLVLERADTAHTGEVRSDMTVGEQEWI